MYVDGWMGFRTCKWLVFVTLLMLFLTPWCVVHLLASWLFTWISRVERERAEDEVEGENGRGNLGVGVRNVLTHREKEGELDAGASPPV